VAIRKTYTPDPIADQSIRCEIEVQPSGRITLRRSPGCTTADAVACQRDGTTVLPGGWDHLEV